MGRRLSPSGNIFSITMNNDSSLQLSICKTVCSSDQVIIQNLPKYTSNTDINHYLKTSCVRGILKWDRASATEAILHFKTPEQAQKYFWERNFSDEILERPVNCFVKIDVEQQYLQRLMVSGVTIANQRAVFEVLRNLGLCRINIKYERDSEQWDAVVQYVGIKEVDDQHLYWLEAQLKYLEVTLYLWRDPHALRYSVALLNFLPQTNQCSSQEAGEVAWRRVAALGLGYSAYPVIEICSAGKSSEDEFVAHPCAIYALMSCNSDLKTLGLFDRLRAYLVENDEVPGKVLLNNSQGWQVNTYGILFSRNIAKQEGLSQRKLEDKLVQVLREVSPSLLFVELVEVRKQSKYNVKLYFTSDAAGREFLAYYPHYLTRLEQFYPKLTKIQFEMYVDRDYLFEIQEGLVEERRISEEQKCKQRRQEMMEEMGRRGREAMLRQFPGPAQFMPSR